MVESPAFPSCRSAGAASQPGVAPRFTLGEAGIDTMLGGGLAQGRLHDVHAASDADIASAAGFALMLAVRAGVAANTIVWLAQSAELAASGALYPPGLAELGADPGRLLFVTVADETTLLKAAADVVRTPAAGVAVIAPAARPKRIDLTATRRLTLFAERSGVTVILLRGAAAPEPSAAATRWRVAAAPSAALEADAPGAPVFAIDLERRRDGPPSAGWRLEWDRDALAFTRSGAPLSGALAAEPGRGLLAAGRA